MPRKTHPEKDRGRQAVLRRDAEITRNAHARRPDAAHEERQSGALKQAISNAFERAQ